MLFLILLSTMTEYGITHNRRINIPSDIVQEKKEARKKLLEAVFQRRREYFIRMSKKMQLHEDFDLDTLPDI